MEQTYHNTDCITKYDILQEYCGFNNGQLVKEDQAISDKTSCIRLSAMGKTSGITVRTDTPNSNVVFKVNGMVHSEVTSDENGTATFDCDVNFDRIHCAQIVSDANLLNFSRKL